MFRQGPFQQMSDDEYIASESEYSISESDGEENVHEEETDGNAPPVTYRPRTTLKIQGAPAMTPFSIACRAPSCRSNP